MFKLLRYFSIASALSMTVATILLAFLYREQAMEDLVRLTEDQNAALARILANDLWPAYGDFITGPLPADSEALRSHPKQAGIDRYLRDHTAGLMLAKVKVYNAAGRAVYSTDRAQVGGDEAGNPGVRRALDRGEISSEIVFQDTISAFEGVVEDRDLVTSYVPAPGGGQPVQGVLELYTDVSPVVERIDYRTTRLVGGLLIVFLSLYGVLFLIVRRADRILFQQYGKLLEVRDELHVELEERDFHIRKQMAERTVAETVLGESGRRFRDFVENSSDWYWEMDANLRFSYLSERFEEYTGIDRDDVIGRTRKELWAFHCPEPDAEAKVRQERHFLDLAGRLPFRNLVVDWRRPDGDLRTFLINGRPVFGENGEFFGYRGTGTDITELRRKDQALRLSMKSLAEAQRIASLGNWTWDVERGTIGISLEGLRILGLDENNCQVGFEDFMACVHDEDRASVRAAIDASLLGGRGFAIEHRVIQGSGEIRNVRTEAEVVFSDDDEPVEVNGIIHDITRLKMTEEALRDSRERYALALQGANDGIWDWDLRTGTLYVSSRVLSIFGYPEDFGGLTPELWRSIVHPDEMEKFTSRFREHLKGKTDFYSCEYRVRRPSGDTIWVLDRAVALRDETGRAFRVAGSVGDVTARRLAEDRLRHSQKMEALGKLAGGIAHEFNNLLVGIGGFANMAVDKIEDPERVRFCLDEVIKASDKAAALTGDLLAFSRQRAAKPTVLTVHLDDVVDDVANLLRTLVRANIDIRFDREDGQVCIDVDPSHLSQVITNLAINARDAMPDGGVLTVGTRMLGADHPVVARNISGPGKDYGCVFVSDTGTGIDKETMKNLFVPFFTTKEPGKGTGLGLATVYGLVEQAGGFIDVESAVGEGSIFSVCVPLSEAEPAEADQIAAEIPRVSGTVATIMVAEDDEAVRILATQTLEDMGHTVISASNGRVALGAARDYSGTIDLLLTDLVMPEMGGRELIEVLVSERPEMGVVVMTAYPDVEGVPDLQGAAKARFLRKPFTPAGLGKLVQEVLESGGNS